VRAEATLEVTSSACLPTDGGTTISAICRKKPMISKAGTFDGLHDGMRKNGKYFDQENQLVIVTIDNRVGVTDTNGDNSVVSAAIFDAA
jgi:hypothetical protein